LFRSIVMQQTLERAIREIQEVPHHAATTEIELRNALKEGTTEAYKRALSFACNDGLSVQVQEIARKALGFAK